MLSYNQQPTQEEKDSDNEQQSEPQRDFRTHLLRHVSHADCGRLRLQLPCGHQLRTNLPTRGQRHGHHGRTAQHLVYESRRRSGVCFGLRVRASRGQRPHGHHASGLHCPL